MRAFSSLETFASVAVRQVEVATEQIMAARTLGWIDRWCALDVALRLHSRSSSREPLDT
jgi:hypothetical protein